MHDSRLSRRLIRNILADKPRVTKFPIDWDPPADEVPTSGAEQVPPLPPPPPLRLLWTQQCRPDTCWLEGCTCRARAGCASAPGLFNADSTQFSGAFFQNVRDCWSRYPTAAARLRGG